MADVHGVGPAGSDYSVAPSDGLANDTIQMSAYAKNHCKNCQLPLVEGGRAYELGGYRWHVECFRCSICSSQMDADTNMLVLGNGTLVCHNCSYFCAICQKKIEDLAILTNDQAFCADCFVCRNCQRRIDDLKYARTSQGIFCMSCHNALMMRKQRKAAAAAAAAAAPVAADPSSSSAAASPAINSSTSRSSSSTQHRLSSLSSRDKELPILPPSTSRTTSNDRPPTLRTQSDTAPAGRQVRSQLPPPVTPQQPKASHRHTRSVGEGTFTGPTEAASQEVPPEITATSPPIGVSESFAAELDTLGTKDWGLEMPVAPEPVLPSTVLGVPIQLESPPSRSPNRSPGKQAPITDRSSPTQSDGSIYSPRAVAPDSPSPTRPMRSPTRSPNRSPTRPVIDDVPLLATPNGERLPKAWTQDTPAGVTAAAPSPSAFAAIERTPHSVSSGQSTLQESNHELETQREELAVPFRSSRRAASPNRLVESTSSISIAASLSPRNWPRTGAEMPAADDSNDIDPSGLMQALIRSRERISELEHLLERELQTSKLAAVEEDPAELSRHIFERRQTLAGLEAQQKVASEELRATRAGTDAEEFLSALTKHKTELLGEIESLTTERDSLRAQVAELVAKRDQALEESSILNTKNSQLVDMNNELLKQTLEKFGPNTLWGSSLSVSSGPSSSTAANAMSPVPSRERKQRVKRKEIAAPEAEYGVPYSGTTGSQERLVDNTPKSPQSARYPGGDNNLVTVLDAPTQKQRKNLWPFRRPGKGLTRVFAQEVTVGDVDSQAVTVLSGSSGPTLPSSSSALTSSTVGPAPGGQPMLGELLEARCAMDQTPVPKIVTRCLNEVEKRGLDTEGIYRKSGSKLQIDQILGYFESNSELLESDLGKDITAVTSAVKQYLRYLADPIIPYAHYNAYVQAGRKHDLSELYVVVKNLPPAHYATLEAIVQHLALVAANESKNLMNSRNLAVVFAPTLARDQTGEREVSDMQARNDATQMLIDNHDMFE